MPLSCYSGSVATRPQGGLQVVSFVELIVLRKMMRRTTNLNILLRSTHRSHGYAKTIFITSLVMDTVTSVIVEAWEHSRVFPRAIFERDG
jgi:hypothetical protein